MIILVINEPLIGVVGRKQAKTKKKHPSIYCFCSCRVPSSENLTIYLQSVITKSRKSCRETHVDFFFIPFLRIVNSEKFSEEEVPETRAVTLN